MAIFETYSLREEDIRVRVDDPQRLIPKTFAQGGGMYRFITAPDLSHRGGFTKLTLGQGFKSFFWYDEYWFVIQGRSRVVATDRASGLVTERPLKARDAVFIGAGTHIHHECTSSDEPLIFMYIAVPASKRDARWLASMLPEDANDVRAREEYDWKWPGKSVREP